MSALGMSIFRDFADILGFEEVPETIPLRILGLVPPVPSRQAIVSAFRRRAIEVHPDLQLAYDNPVLQAGAEGLITRPEIRELVWARDELVKRAPDPDRVTDKSHTHDQEFVSVTPTAKVCRKCQRTLGEDERYAVSPYVEYSRRAGWCWRCARADENARARDRRRRRHPRATRPCAQCAALFTPPRADGRYCSPRCRQAAFRSRVTANKPYLQVTLSAVT